MSGGGERRERFRLQSALHSAELRAVAQRTRQVGALAVITGMVTGLAVAGFDRLVDGQLFERLMTAPLWLQAVGPAVGLAIAALALRFLAGGASPATADEYIRDFHEAEARLDLKPVPGRLVASAATLGGGAAMGFEGPSIYIGAAIGSWLQRRFSRVFPRADAKLLLVCGAAAGVAAIFKAPATGLVFALEVPYRQDLARRMLLPAMFSAAASYVVFVAINGTDPLFPIAGAPPFNLRDLGGAALLGLACGGFARVFNLVIRSAKSAVSRFPATRRVPVAAAVLVVVFVLGRLLTGESLLIGSGYGAIDWSLEPGHAAAVIFALFVLRGIATTLAVGAGGVGGLFVPLVTQGALLGAALGAAVGAPDESLFPVLGVAAFLGAGYRVPLAAVVFVAESTGRPGFVVPGLIAAATSQLLMGRSSASPYQQDTRSGILETRLALPVSSALRTDAATVPSDATLQEVFEHHITELRLRSVPVVDGSDFRGMVTVHDLVAVSRALWETTEVGEIMRADWPTADVTWSLGAAVNAMEEGDVDRLPVLDGEGYVGIVTTGEILKLDAILDTTDDAARKPGIGG